MEQPLALTYGDWKKWKQGGGGDWSHDILEQLLTVFTYRPPLLDLGSGNGRWRKLFPEDTVSFELGALSAKPFVRGVAQHLPFKPEAFRTVVAVTVIQHVPFPEKPLVYEEILRILQPGGLFLMVEGNSHVTNDYLWTVPVKELAESVHDLFHTVAIIEPEMEYCGLLLRKQ